MAVETQLTRQQLNILLKLNELKITTSKMIFNFQPTITTNIQKITRIEIKVELE